MGTSPWLAAFLLACSVGCPPGSLGASDSAGLAPQDAEVQIISPRPGVNIPSGAVRLRARVAVRAGGGRLPVGWALSISLDEDGESTVVPGAVVDGELPALSPGLHSITIALVDGEASGAMLGISLIQPSVAPVRSAEYFSV